MQAVRPVPQFLTEGNPPQNCSLQEGFPTAGNWLSRWGFPRSGDWRWFPALTATGIQSSVLKETPFGYLPRGACKRRAAALQPLADC
jgi:hypothetical protein